MRSQRVLRFGIPTLDRLLGRLGRGENQTFGIGLRSIVDGSVTATVATGADRQDTAKTNSDEGHSDEDATSVCIVGSDGTGKSLLAMHLASKYKSDALQLHTQDSPFVIYASTDLTFSRAKSSWENFALHLPDYRVEDPFDLAARVSQDWLKPEPEPNDTITLKNHIPLEQDFPSKSGRDVVFLDLATHTTGDDWGYLNRVIGMLPSIGESQPEHLLVVDAVEGLEVLVGETDAFGQKRDRRSRVAQLIRTAARKCHIVFLVESQDSGVRTPEEFIADAVIKLSIQSGKQYDQRVVSVEKVRGQTHVRGFHDIAIRSGYGSTTGTRQNPDDPFLPHPEQLAKLQTELPKKELLFPDPKLFERKTKDENSEAVSSGDAAGQPRRAVEYSSQAYMYVFHSLHFYSRDVVEEYGQSIGAAKYLAGFGIEHLDNILLDERALESERKADVERNVRTEQETKAEASTRDVEKSCKHGDELAGDRRGIRVADTTAIIGEDGTYKSKLSKAFLAQAQHPYWKDNPGASILVTNKVIDDLRLKARLGEHVESKDREAGKNVFCRRLEVHYISSAVLFHIVRQIIQRAQAELFYDSESGENSIVFDEPMRREKGWKIRLVIDNWTTIGDTYPQVRDDPLFLPCLLFHLRREGIASLMVASEDPGFARAYALRKTHRLRDLTSTQIYTWRVPYFGENRVAIKVNPPQAVGGSVIRELRLLKEKKTRHEHQTGSNEHTQSEGIHTKPNDSRRIGVNPSFELYDGLEEGDLKYVKLAVRLFGTSQEQNEYFDDIRVMFDRLLDETGKAPEITIESPVNYKQLREFCELQGVARFPYTLVLQVDEYWAKSNSLQLHPQTRYLCAPTASLEMHREKPDTDLEVGLYHSYIVEDPFRLFQPSRKDIRDEKRSLEQDPKLVIHDSVDATKPKQHDWSRAKLFTPVGYSLETHLAKKQNGVVKVPYSWDFGFLMLNRHAWQETMADHKVSAVWAKLKRLQNGTRSNKANPSWRKFARACTRVAEMRNAKNSRGDQKANFVPFAVAPEVHETVSCLFLEILVSEIESNKHLDYASRSRRVPVKSIDDVFRRRRDEPESELDLRDIFRSFQPEVVSTLLILSALLPPEVITDDNRVLDQAHDGKVPVAIRSWYASAGLHQKSELTGDLFIPAQLPGSRSVRGDWFLATARGSRSYQMGERAIDLLCSRRANIVRLQTGIGLPVRDAEPPESRELWTSLWYYTDADRRDRRITYQELQGLGETDRDEEVKWIWRSRIKQYDRHSRLLRRWICSMLRRRDELTKGARPLDVHKKLRGLDMTQIEQQGFDGFENYIVGFLGSLDRASIVFADEYIQE